MRGRFLSKSERVAKVDDTPKGQKIATPIYECLKRSLNVAAAVWQHWKQGSWLDRIRLLSGFSAQSGEIESFSILCRPFFFHPSKHAMLTQNILFETIGCDGARLFDGSSSFQEAPFYLSIKQFAHIFPTSKRCHK
jgi:hypothetical protein